MFLFGSSGMARQDRRCAIFTESFGCSGGFGMGIARRGVIAGVAAAVVASVGSSRIAASAATVPQATATPAPTPTETPAPVRVHLGSYTGTGGPGIGSGTVDPVTGALTIDGWLADIADPSWLERSPDGATLYAISETSAGAVHALDLAGPGAPVAGAATVTGDGPAHLAVHPTGSHLFTSLYGGGAVAVHPIAADGSVGAATTVRRHAPDVGRGAAHAHQVVFDPTGRWALSVDLGTESVYVEEFDPATGTLGEPVRVRSAAGAGPRHLALHPTGGYAYVANELNSTVTVCRWQDGVLTPGASLSTVAAPSSARNYPSGIVVSPDGRFVYLANRGDDSIAVFAVSGDGAALDLVATPSCGGHWPRHLALAPGGAWLYVANQRSGDVSWLRVDPETGVPGAVSGSIDVPGAAHILFG
jgi:6-phosphogluconolactonase (cycloisomerase 2 family)